MSVHEGQPFAAKYRQVMKNAGGMRLSRADTEFRDNAFEAGSMYSNTKIAFIEGSYYLVYWDGGKGVDMLPHLYGLGNKMPTKTDDDMAGMYNHGHVAATAYWNPEFAYSETKCDGRYESLEFRTKEFVEAIKTCHDDLRRANINMYLRISEERFPSKAKMLASIIEQTHDTTMKQQLNDILNNVAPHYMLNVFKMHATAPLPEQEFVGFFANLRLYYYEALLAGKSITLELSNNSTMFGEHPKLLIADASNVIDPLHNRAQFPPFLSHFELKQPGTFDNPTGRRMGKLTLSLPTGESIDPIYCVFPEDKRCKYAVYDEKEPAEWNTSSTILVLDGATNHISDSAVDQQFNKDMINHNGSDFTSVESHRGVWIGFGQRILGKPHWQSGGEEHRGFLDKRNSHFPRCYVKPTGQKEIVANLMNVQANKHVVDLTTCDKLIHQYMYAIFGIVIKKYTTYTINGSGQGRITPWNLTELRNFILNKTPVSNDSSNEDEEKEKEEDEEEEEENDGEEEEEEEEEEDTDGYTYAQLNGTLIVSHNGKELKRIKYKGDISILYNMITEVKGKVHPDVFPVYLKGLADLHTIIF